jgi:hypothetical protein
MIGPESADVRGRLAEEIRRVSDRLRMLPLARLSAPLPPYGTRAEAGHAVAQRLAEAAQGIEARDAPQPPAWREVPRLAEHGTADLIAVTGQDLLDALASAGADAQVWTRAGQSATRAGQSATRAPIRDAVERAAADLRELRLAL